MFKIQCDKNLKSVLKRFFYLQGINAEILTYSEDKANICILRNFEDIPANFIPNSNYLIINSDDQEILNKIKGTKSKIISCGFATRSSITLSSISDEKCVMCFQRSILNLAGEKLSPFELPFESCGKTFDHVSTVMILTAALLCGAKVSQLKKIYL